MATASSQQRVLRVLALVVALWLTTSAIAADAGWKTSDWSPRTGDAAVDATLADINQYAARYPDAFADEIVRYHAAPRALVDALLQNPQWTPGDIYYACALAQTAGQPCRAVAEQWQRDHGQGWGAIARGIGVQPGSPEFERLKHGFVSTYDRWGRPLQVEAATRDDHHDRGKH